MIRTNMSTQCRATSVPAGGGATTTAGTSHFGGTCAISTRNLLKAGAMSEGRIPADPITTAEAARILGVTRQRVEFFIRARRLGSTRIGHLRVLERAEVSAFALQRPVRPPSQSPASILD